MNFIDQHWERIVFSITVLIVAFVITRILRMLVGRFFKSAAKKLKVDPTRYNFFKNAIDFIVFLGALIFIFISIPAFHTIGTTLLTGAGVLAAILGFASQSAFSNIVSGVFLVIFKPFRVGDRIKIGEKFSGDVEDITLRHTVIVNFENRRVVIPNSVISTEVIINATLTDEKVCMFVEVGISYDADIDKAMELIQQEAKKIHFLLDNRSVEEKNKGEHEVAVRMLGFNDSAVQLRAYAWARSPAEGFELKCELYKKIKQRFDQEKIEIPYPHRTIVYKDKATDQLK